MNEDDPIDRPVRLRFRFSESEADALGSLARPNGVSLAALVRKWLYTALDNNTAYRASDEGVLHVNSACK